MHLYIASRPNIYIYIIYILCIVLIFHELCWFSKNTILKALIILYLVFITMHSTNASFWIFMKQVTFVNQKQILCIINYIKLLEMCLRDMHEVVEVSIFIKEIMHEINKSSENA